MVVQLIIVNASWYSTKTNICNLISPSEIKVLNGSIHGRLNVEKYGQQIWITLDKYLNITHFNIQVSLFNVTQSETCITNLTVIKVSVTCTY